jgi:predicted TIM-barrel fold metal-dependent hydrolase
LKYTCDKFSELQPVDVTAFIGQWPSRLQTNAAAEDLLAMADHFRLTAMCVSHIASIFGHDTRSGNEALFKETAKDERLLPFPIINPSEVFWRKELQWAVDSGAKGIRLVPGYHRYHLVDRQVKEMIAEVKSLKIPLHICARLEDERVQNSFSQANSVPTHMIAETLTILENHPAVISGLRESEWDEVVRFIPSGINKGLMFCDLWFTNGPISVISSICKRGRTATFVYGSCTPIQTAMATAYQLETANISEAERCGLCRENALRFLGL